MIRGKDAMKSTTEDRMDVLIERIRAKDDTPYMASYNDLVGDLRHLLDSFASGRPDPEGIDDAGALLRQLTAAFRQVRVEEPELPWGRGLSTGSRAQCLFPDLKQLKLTPTTYEATVVFGEFHRGFGGAAHGGAVSMLMDEAVGVIANINSDVMKRTAYLNTSFRALTPIGVELDVLSEVARVEGRKHFYHVTLSREGQVCAETEALMIEARQ